MRQQEAGSNISAIRIADCDQLPLIDPVFSRGVGGELGKIVSLPLKIFQVENAFSEAAKKSRHAVFQHSSPRAKQRRAGSQLMAERDQISFIAAGAMQEQQSYFGIGVLGTNEAMNETGFCGDH